MNDPPVAPPATLLQCEGCLYPLGKYLDAYERGEITVTWYVCLEHNATQQRPYDPEC